MTKGIIKQEEAIDYEEIKCFELVKDEKVGYCTMTEDQKVEFYELIEDKYVEIIECDSNHVDDWKKFELSNKSIALNVLYVPEGKKTIRHAYKLKYNLTHENRVILLMIGDGEKWHYLTGRGLSALLKGITSKHKDDSYCLNCFHSYPSKKSLEKHMKVCEDKDYCYIEMPKKGESLKYQPGVKSMKAPYIIVADIESLFRKMDTCANDPSKSSTEKKNEHEMCGYSLFTDCSFNKKNNKLDYYRGKDSLKRFCQDLKKQARSIIDFEKKKMNLTPEEELSFYMTDKCYICNKPFYKDKKKIIILK